MIQILNLIRNYVLNVLNINEQSWMLLINLKMAECLN